MVNLFYLSCVLYAVIMQLLAENFLIFTCCGCWMPESATNSKCKSIVYNLYSFTLFALVIGLISMKITNVAVGSFRSIQEFAIATFALADFMCAVFKSITVYRKRDELFEIERTFLRCINNNNDEEERKIQQNFDKICRYKLISLLI